MSTALAENLRELSKTELVERALSHARRGRALLERHKETIRHIGFTIAGGVASTAAGMTAGVLELKFRTIPKLPFLRTDSVLAAALSGLNCFRVFGDATPIFDAAANGLNGHAWGRYTEKFLISKGVKKNP